MVYYDDDGGLEFDGKLGIFLGRNHRKILMGIDMHLYIYYY